MVSIKLPDDERDIVELRDHDPVWKDLFQLERASLLKSLGPLAMTVEHVGSTAVPNLRAKPIIDILVTVNEIRLDALEDSLGRLGYVHVPIGDPERLFFRKGMPRTHHVHVVRHGGNEHRKHLIFRDRLIAHPEELAEYERLKESLALRFREDRQAYSDGKDGFIVMILDRAKDERRSKT
ncbi:MAG TPA: GrpB family protein [Methanomassiliicoccales archaeon]|nr:GrpB family protein [Methanomassiliicoccales archaeon]HPR98984.1 GrpB family protein [Methanomassiliicoccales archaeon]